MNQDQPGSRIGHFKVLQQLGEGGCGVVFLAEQQEPFKRRVALKVIKLGLDTKQVTARFESERQALARMDHPNIAKILEAGITPSGRPFFAMEFIRGVKITNYCDQNDLSITDRLKLIIPVCNAISHAHNQGIIHRDIKPSNVLVTVQESTPVPKVIDFGIAKALNGQRLTDLTVFTSFEQFVGTPAYMSPEQAEMVSELGPPSDVYSVGVLLYELLTGRPPLEISASAGMDEIRRVIRSEEPPTPSSKICGLELPELTHLALHRRVEPAQLIKLVRGEVDWIVAKALDKDSQRRYQSAGELAADINRYLEGESVSAVAPTALYKIRKAAARHPVAAVTTSVTILCAIAVAVTSLVLLEAKRSEVVARQEAQHLQMLRIADLAVRARFLANEQRLKEAETAYREALQVKSTLSPGAESELHGWFDRLSFALGRDLGSLLVAQDRMEEARMVLGEALPFRTKVTNERIAIEAKNLAYTCREAGLVQESRDLFSEALQFQQKAHGLDDAETIDLCLWVGRMESALGHRLEAIKSFDQVLARRPGYIDVASAVQSLSAGTNLVTVLADSEIIPSEWAYTFDKPAGDWPQSEFDDSGWLKGPGGFGTPQPQARTRWNGRMIWVRRAFNVERVPQTPLFVRSKYDDLPIFYLNGVQACTRSNWSGGIYLLVPCSREAAATLHTGRNVMAVTCENVRLGGFIDAGLVTASAEWSEKLEMYTTNNTSPAK